MQRARRPADWALPEISRRLWCELLYTERQRLPGGRECHLAVQSIGDREHHLAEDDGILCDVADALPALPIDGIFDLRIPPIDREDLERCGLRGGAADPAADQRVLVRGRGGGLAE